MSSFRVVIRAPDKPDRAAIVDAALGVDQNQLFQDLGIDTSTRLFWRGRPVFPASLTVGVLAQMSTPENNQLPVVVLVEAPARPAGQQHQQHQQQQQQQQHHQQQQHQSGVGGLRQRFFPTQASPGSEQEPFVAPAFGTGPVNTGPQLADALDAYGLSFGTLLGLVLGIAWMFALGVFSTLFDVFFDDHTNRLARREQTSGGSSADDHSLGLWLDSRGKVLLAILTLAWLILVAIPSWRAAR